MSSADARAEEIVALWKERKDRGEAADPDDLVAEHPDLEVEIRVRLSALELLDRAFGEAVLARAGAPTLGDFRDLRELGRGGMGVVYEAEQISMRRTVALKVLFPSITLSSQAVQRFRREAQAAGRLHHTNIVPVYGMGEESGVWFYVMERVHGHTLADVIADARRKADGAPAVAEHAPPTPLGTTGAGRTRWARIASAFAGLAEALEHAHAQGVVHRDLKPSNVLLDQDGTLRITDFGVARIADETMGLTVTGDLVGTPAYMSPEQVRKGATPLDGRTDVFSLGATLYEVLTLRPPFAGKDIPTVFAQILASDPAPPRRVDPSIPKDLETVVLKALEKDPAARYRTAGEFAHDLRMIGVGAEVKARRLGVLARGWRLVKRHPARAIATGAVVALVAALAMLSMQADTEREAARLQLYETVLSRYQLELIGAIDPGRTSIGDPDRASRARATLEEAIGIAPERPGAYLARLTIRNRTLEERLADVDGLRTRGLSARSIHVLRAAVLTMHDQIPEADREQALAAALPEDVDPPWAVDLVWARALVRQGWWSRAVSTLDGVLARMPERDPQRTSAYFLRGEAKEKLEDWVGALEDAMRIQPEGAVAWVGRKVHLARLFRRLKQPERADALCAEAVADVRASGSFDQWRDLCHACAVSQDWALLERVASEARKLYPTEIRFSLRRSSALNRLGRAAEARDEAKASLLMDPTYKRGHGELARALMALGKPDDALAEARLAEDASAEAFILGKLGRKDEALEVARTFADGKPFDHNARCMLAQMLADGKQYGEALGEATRAIELEPSCGDCRVWRAAALQGAGRAAEGLVDADRAVEDRPKFRDAWTIRVKCLRDLDRRREALEAWDRADAIKPLGLDWHNVRGVILTQMGRYEDAIAAYERVIAEQPDHPWAGPNRAIAWIQTGRAGDALAAASAALEKDPKAPNWARARVLALCAQGDLTAALTACEAALLVEPTNVALVKDRALLLASYGRFDEALASVEQAMAEFPGDRTLRIMRIHVLLEANRGDEAVAAARKLPRDDLQTERDAVVLLAWTLHLTGHAREVASVLAAYEKAPEAIVGPWTARMLALSGRGAEARARLDLEALPDERTACFSRACTYAILGDKDQAIHWLGVAADQGYRRSRRSPENPDMAAFKDDARYRAAMERILLP